MCGLQRPDFEGTIAGREKDMEEKLRMAHEGDDIHVGSSYSGSPLIARKNAKSVFSGVCVVLFPSPACIVNR